MRFVADYPRHSRESGNLIAATAAILSPCANAPSAQRFPPSREWCIWIFGILFAVFLAGCGGGVNILPEPFTRERADGKIPVKVDLIRAQVRRELDGMPEGESEVARWQAIEFDYNACRLSSTESSQAKAEEVFADCMSRRGYVYMFPIDAEQLHNDVAAELTKERNERLAAEKQRREHAAKIERQRREEAEIARKKTEAERLAAEKKAAEEAEIARRQKELDDALQPAITAKDIDEVRRLLAAGANPNAAYVFTPLHWALLYNQYEIANALIEAGADMNAMNIFGDTALMSRARAGYVDDVKFLLSAGASYVRWNEEYKTALIMAAEEGHAEVIKILLSEGTALLDWNDNDGWTALLRAARGGHSEVAKVLLSAGANPNAKRKDDGGTALMWAAWEGHSEVAEILLAAGANPNAADDNGITALMTAAKNGHSEVVKMLLSAGAKVNHRTKNDWTALHWAAKEEHSDITALLLSCGANPNLKNNHGNTAWGWGRNNLSVLSIFEEYQRKFDSGWRPQSCKGQWGIVAAESPQAANIAESVFENVWRSVVNIRQGESQGSGVIVRPNVVATNCHVLDGYGDIVVYQHDNRLASSDTRFNASVRKQDTARDFCLLNVGGLNGTPAKVRRYDTLKIGEDVYAVGSPKGLDLSLSTGVISQLRHGNGKRWIQIDAAISPGSSGGGLFDSDGNLIGITTEKITDEDAEGLGFAIPADLVLGR